MLQFVYCRRSTAARPTRAWGGPMESSRAEQSAGWVQSEQSLQWGSNAVDATAELDLAASGPRTTTTACGALLAIEIAGMAFMWAAVPFLWIWVGKRIGAATDSLTLAGGA